MSYNLKILLLIVVQVLAGLLLVRSLAANIRLRSQLQTLKEISAYQPSFNCSTNERLLAYTEELKKALLAKDKQYAQVQQKYANIVAKVEENRSQFEAKFSQCETDRQSKINDLNTEIKKAQKLHQECIQLNKQQEAQQQTLNDLVQNYEECQRREYALDTEIKNQSHNCQSIINQLKANHQAEKANLNYKVQSLLLQNKQYQSKLQHLALQISNLKPYVNQDEKNWI